MKIFLLHFQVIVEHLGGWTEDTFEIVASSAFRETVLPATNFSRYLEAANPQASLEQAWRTYWLQKSMHNRAFDNSYGQTRRSGSQGIVTAMCSKALKSLWIRADGKESSSSRSFARTKVARRRRATHRPLNAPIPSNISRARVHRPYIRA